MTTPAGSTTPTLLDGAGATAMRDRGYALEPPLWSAAFVRDHPEAVTALHRDYADAGAEVLTTQTFGTAPWQLDPTESQRLTAKAVACVTAVRDSLGGQLQVAGSVPPALGPGASDDALRRSEADFAAQGQRLREAGADLLFAETFACVREAASALRGLGCAGLPIWISLCLRDAETLIGGAPVAAIAGLSHPRLAAIVLGCTSTAIATEAAPALTTLLGAPLGLACNTDPSAETPDTWAEDLATTAQRCGASVVGGCCGTTPQHIAALHRRLVAGSR